MKDNTEQFINIANENLPDSKPNRSLMQRIFGPIELGSVRGNMFLLIVTTIGSSFFILPHCARHIGLIFTFLMVLFAALLSSTCSKLLYLGFKVTNAQTYNECMEILLGKKMGLASTLVIMLHTLGSVISTWIFSWMYLSNGIMQFLNVDPTTAPNLIWFQYSFFIIGFGLLFVLSLFRTIEKLKIVSILGFGMIIYLVLVLIGLTPEYFNYYNQKGEITVSFFKADWYGLKTWGICNYMFLNQYAIMPICKTTKNISFERITKIIRRCIITVFVLYVMVLLSGYFSLPTKVDKNNEIFLLRKPLEGSNDLLIKYGKILFGLALLVGVMVRGHFMLIYFDQLIQNFRTVLDVRGYTAMETDQFDKANGETSTMYPITSSIVWKPNAILRNLLFLVSITLMATFGVNYLVRIIGFIGSLVGVFELVIIPGLMFLAVDTKASEKYLTQFNRIAVIIGIFMISAISFAAVIANLIIP